MKPLVIFLLALLTAIVSHAAPVPIFDGKTLDGWEGDAKLWRVEDGMITGGSLTEKVAHNDFLATRKAYANFDLRVKIKLTGTEGFINSGVQIRSVRVPGSPEMSGYQVDYGKGWYGKLYDESRRNKVVGEAKDLKAATAAIHEGEWNEYRVCAEGPRIQSWINGVPALDYTEPDPMVIHDGQIGIQVHGGGKALVQAKDVTIEELPGPSPLKVKIEGAELAPPGFADAAEKTLKDWYPRVRHILGVDYATPEEITLRFRDFDGVAHTKGAVIEASTKFFAKHPDDVGAILHELVHVIQAYPPGSPGWLVEGVADYVRYYYYEPVKGAAFRAKPGQSYKGGYNPAAALLASAQVGKPKTIIAELNRRGHAGRLTEEAFKEITGQTPDEVWGRVPGSKAPPVAKPAPDATPK
jgi:hypothetical protein